MLLWITGASTGIGRAVARSYAARGETVAVSARGADALQSLASECDDLPGTIVVKPCDTTDEAATRAVVESLAAEYGPIDLALLNAGIYIPVRHAPFDRDAYRKTFDVNLSGTVNCLGPLIDQMVPRRAGRIYFVSSVAGYSGLPNSAAYGASKAALINMAESLKFDLDNHGVEIGVVNPGFVKTPATDQNDFDMPFLMEVDDAAKRIVEGLDRGGFEITFPRRFTYQLKFLRLLPHWAYFPLVSRMTGWSKKID